MYNKALNETRFSFISMVVARSRKVLWHRVWLYNSDAVGDSVYVIRERLFMFFYKHFYIIV